MLPPQLCCRCCIVYMLFAQHILKRFRERNMCMLNLIGQKQSYQWRSSYKLMIPAKTMFLVGTHGSSSNPARKPGQKHTTYTRSSRAHPNISLVRKIDNCLLPQKLHRIPLGTEYKLLWSHWRMCQQHRWRKRPIPAEQSFQKGKNHRSRSCEEFDLHCN